MFKIFFPTDCYYHRSLRRTLVLQQILRYLNQKAFLFRGRLSVILFNIQVLSNFLPGENLLCALCMFHYLLHCGRESNYEKLLHQKKFRNE